MPALPARSPPLGPRVLAPPPPRTAQRDSCVQSGTTYNSRRFRRETSAWSAAPLRSLSSPRRPAAFGSPPEPLGRRIVLGGALRPGNGGQRSPVGAARRRRGGSARGRAVGARGGSPRRLGRSSCERARPPSLLRQRLVGERRAGPAPSRRACVLPRGFPAAVGENGWLGCGAPAGTQRWISSLVSPSPQLRHPEEEELGSEKCSHEFWSCHETWNRLVGRAERGERS